MRRRTGGARRGGRTSDRRRLVAITASLLATFSALAAACTFSLPEPIAASAESGPVGDSPSSTGDGGSSSGNPTDAPTSSDAPSGPTFCTSVTDATFCEDFDRGIALNTSFPPMPTGNHGLVEISTVASESPPSSLRVTTEPLDSSAGYTAYASKRFAAGITQVVAELDLQFTVEGTQGFAHVLQVTVGPAGAPDWLSLVVHPDGALELFERVSGSTALVSGAGSIPPGTWAHLRLERTGLGGAGNVVVMVNGAKTASAALGSTLGGEVAAHVGIVRAQAPTGSWTVYADNLVLWAN